MDIKDAAFVEGEVSANLFLIELARYRDLLLTFALKSKVFLFSALSNSVSRQGQFSYFRNHISFFSLLDFVFQLQSLHFLLTECCFLFSLRYFFVSLFSSRCLVFASSERLLQHISFCDFHILYLYLVCLTFILLFFLPWLLAFQTLVDPS